MQQENYNLAALSQVVQDIKQMTKPKESGWYYTDTEGEYYGPYETASRAEYGASIECEPMERGREFCDIEEIEAPYCEVCNFAFCDIIIKKYDDICVRCWEGS